MENRHIMSVEWAQLIGRRPRHAGCNARLGEHGIEVRVPIARVTTEDSASGFGFCSASEQEAEALVGSRLAEVFDLEVGASGAGAAFDFPLWDLAGHRAGEPVYRLAARMAGKIAPEQLTAPCYDTSLYFDDLHLSSEQDATQLLAEEAREGYERGHRAFKIKVGRGARHMSLEEGTARDIAIVRAVQEEVGEGVPLMLDANNGYNLNLAKRVLAETADCNIFWLEEAFHEDKVLYDDLRGWLAAQALDVLIADGEGQASPSLLDWAKAGTIDVVQYDIFAYGFSNWLKLGAKLDGWGARSAPHHYGRLLGNYAAPHLAGAIENFTFAEWDQASTEGLDDSGYQIVKGRVHVPDAPGFGLSLDEAWFEKQVSAHGWSARVR